jgi:hypothetical protein
MRTPALMTAAALLCLAAGPATRPSVDERIDQLLAPPSVGRPMFVPSQAPARPATRPASVREGTPIDAEVGTLGHTADGQAVFTSADYPPMLILANQELDAMERRQAALGGGPATFRVSGITTEYKGRPYLFVQSSVDETAVDVGGRAPTRAEGRAVDRTSGKAAVAPGAPVVHLIREGRHLDDATGRVNHSADGRVATFTFDADGKAMRDPPMILLPSLKLAFIEGQQLGLNKDAKFRVSGTVTEYRGRNYLLLDKVVYVQDFDADF